MKTLSKSDIITEINNIFLELLQKVEKLSQPELKLFISHTHQYFLDILKETSNNKNNRQN